MAWSDKQKQLAVRACREAGIDDDQRSLILRQFKRANHAGKITSTAPALTNQDYAEFMAVVERCMAGGKLLHFTARYWQEHAADAYGRMRYKARAIAEALEAAGKLAADGRGLAGWISKRVSQGQADQLEDLDYHGLLALILQLQAYARQQGVKLDSTE